MRFGPVPLARAEGALLAHSLRVGDLRIAKGTALTQAHCEALTQAGHTDVVVARLEPGDVAENAAATKLATALASDPGALGLRIASAGAGRVNLYATGPGVLGADVAALHRINGVDPMITLATLPPFARLEAGTMIATIKIIAYGVKQAALAAACAGAAGALRRLPPQMATASLIETQHAQAQPSPKGRAAIEARLARLDVALGEYRVVSHAPEPLAQALEQMTGGIVLILTASATADIADIAPDALRRAGGRITAYGMPVDPGNLLFFGERNTRPVIGLPGCARSPALNGADWVLERLICGVPLSRADIQAMGVGGLLKETPARPRPRTATEYRD